MSHSKSLKKCRYAECALPVNNNYYLWQIAFLLFGVFSLLGDATQFNLFTIFVFILPVLIDLFYNSKLNPPWLRVVRMIFIVFNMLVAIVCVTGFRGIIIDAGDCFVISERALYLAGCVIHKKYLAGLIIIDIFVPCMFFFGSPCQASMQAIQIVHEKTGLKV